MSKIKANYQIFNAVWAYDQTWKKFVEQLWFEGIKEDDILLIHREENVTVFAHLWPFRYSQLGNEVGNDILYNPRIGCSKTSERSDAIGYYSYFIDYALNLGGEKSAPLVLELKKEDLSVKTWLGDRNYSLHHVQFKFVRRLATKMLYAKIWFTKDSSNFSVQVNVDFDFVDDKFVVKPCSTGARAILDSDFKHAKTPYYSILAYLTDGVGIDVFNSSYLRSFKYVVNESVINSRGQCVFVNVEALCRNKKSAFLVVGQCNEMREVETKFSKECIQLRSDLDTPLMRNCFIQQSEPGAVWRWAQYHDKIIELCLLFGDILPSYVLLEIVNYMPEMASRWKDTTKVSLIQAMQETMSNFQKK